MHIPDEFDRLTQAITSSIAAVRGASGHSTEYAMGRLGEFLNLKRKIAEFETAWAAEPRLVRNRIAADMADMLSDVRQLFAKAAAEKYWGLLGIETAV